MFPPPPQPRRQCPRGQQWGGQGVQWDGGGAQSAWGTRAEVRGLPQVIRAQRFTAETSELPQFTDFW